jgi:hypothetical protein
LYRHLIAVLNETAAPFVRQCPASTTGGRQANRS